MPIRVNMPALMRLFFGRHSWLPLMTGHPFWEATFDQHLGWLLVRGFTVFPIEPWWTNWGEIIIRIQTFSLKKMPLKMSSAKWWSFCLCLNGLNLNTGTNKALQCVTYDSSDFNSLWPSDAMKPQGTASTLGQEMACCLTAPSHYLNQCWLIISKVMWHSQEGIILRRSEDTNQ